MVLLMCSARTFALALAALAALGPTRALANGRPAATATITFDPNQPNRIVAGATFGTLVSDDLGANWRLVCEVPLGTAGIPTDPTYRLVRTTGTWLVATPSALYYSRDGGCSFTKAAGSMAMQSATDAAASPADPMRVLATTNTAGVPNGVHVSMDGGATFTAPANAEAGLTYRGVRFAGDSGQRVYTMSYDGASSITRFYRSDDAGATFTPTGYVANGETIPVLVGSDPRNPDVVYYYARDNGQTRLHRSPDAGVTFQVSSPADVGSIFGVVFNAGGTMYMATNQGVRKSPDGLVFAPPPTNAVVVTCLAIQGSTLFGCAVDSVDGFAVGKSSDEGTNWMPLLRYNQNIVGPLVCGPGTQVCTDCYSMWPTFAAQFSLPNQTAPECMTAPDAGTGGSGGGGKGGGGGCSFALAPVALGGGASLLVAVVVTLLATRRRRRGR
jgi:hypothetical protein